MNRIIFKGLAACGVLLVVTIIVGFLIVNEFNYSFKDVTFVEGIIEIILGVLASMGGESRGLSLLELGQINAQYISNANLEITRQEREKSHYSIRNILRISVSSINLIICGIFCIVLDLII